MFHRANFVFWLASVIGMVAALVMALSLYDLLDTIEAKTNTRNTLLSLAGELRQSSDDLTRFARTYAATGNDSYKNRYQAVLDIREGQVDRPEGYEHVYWDLEQIGLLKDTKNAGRVPLLTRLRESGMDSYMVDLLATSKARSDQLVNLERRAFSLVEIGYTNQAVKILFSDDYHQAKGQILEPIRHFQLRVDSETAAALATALQNTRDTMRVSIATITLALILGGLAGLYRRVKPGEEETEVHSPG